MSLECVNVMNKQELGSNSSKTVEHGHDACDSHKSSSDREEGEVEDGEIDDDDERKIDDSNGSPTILEKAANRKTVEDPDSDNENHGSKRHKDRKRRHKKEKRHHHISHKRRHQSPENVNAAGKNDGSPPLSKKSRRSEEEHRGKHHDYDRPPSGDEDFGMFGANGNRGAPNRVPSHNSRSHNGARRRSARSGSPSPRDDDRDSPASASQASEDRMQDLFSDGDDLDLDVAAHERDGAFQRSVIKPERQQPKTKRKKNKGKWKEQQWSNKPRRDDDGPPRRWEPERKRCRFYMEGRCGKADHCPYSHDFKPPKKLELCKFYAISNCLKGEYCVYMHEEFPCKFYHTGSRSCRFESDCKFSHEPLTPETKMVLERFIEERDSNNNGEGDEGRDNCPTPFSMFDDDRIEEIPEILDDRKNSLLGSPPSHFKDRNRNNRMQPRESPGLCDQMPDRMGPPGGPTPPANFGPGLGPQGNAMSPPQNALPTGLPPSSMPPMQRPFGFQGIPPGIPESAGMAGPMGMRPQLPGMRQMGPAVSGPMGGVVGSGPHMLLAGRGMPPGQFGPRLRGMRPPANMVAPPVPQNALPPPVNLAFGGPRPVGPPVINPQLDNLASMLVQAAKQQGKKPEEEAEATSMLKAAGADDSDLEEEADSLDAMVHRMRKDAEEQQRQRSLQGVHGPPGFQPMSRPPLSLPSDVPMSQPHGLLGSVGPRPFGPNGPLPLPHQIPHPHGPSAQSFPPRAPGYTPQLSGPPPTFVAVPEDKTAQQQLYLRIAKQTANGMQEQMAREQSAETVETPASPPPQEVEVEARAWKLIQLEVPLKTPYPLMQLPHDLPYSRADPRLTGQLRLVGGTKQETQPPPQDVQPQPQTPEHLTPPQEPFSKTPPQKTPPQQQQQPAVPDVGIGRPYIPSLSPTATPKDPRLGRTVPEVPAALLQKPLAALPLDLEPPDRPPPKMQLSERSSSFQAAAPLQPESRAYLLDPRFRRRKASLPSAATAEHPDEPKKDSTPVPSSGESSPVE